MSIVFATSCCYSSKRLFLWHKQKAVPVNVWHKLSPDYQYQWSTILRPYILPPCVSGPPQMVQLACWMPLRNIIYLCTLWNNYLYLCIIILFRIMKTPDKKHEAKQGQEGHDKAASGHENGPNFVKTLYDKCYIIHRCSFCLISVGT